MTAQNGSLMLIKVGDGGDPEVFATIGGLRVSRIILNNRPLDASHAESGVWRQLLSNAGIRDMSISGNGMFTNAVSEETLRGYAFSGTVNNYRLLFANGDSITAPFLVTSYERSGNHDNEETYAVTLASAGDMTFAAT